MIKDLRMYVPSMTMQQPKEICDCFYFFIDRVYLTDTLRPEIIPYSWTTCGMTAMTALRLKCAGLGLCNLSSSAMI